MGLFSGWAAGRDENDERLDLLPQRYSQFDLVLSWEVKAAGAETVIDGVVKNVRYAHMEGLEVWVALLDASGTAAVRSSCFIVPHRLRQDQVAPFTITLPVVALPGTRLRFTYKYQGTEDGAGNFQSFDSAVPAP